VELVNIGVGSFLERFPVLGPVLVLVEAHLPVLLSIPSLNADAQVFAEAFEDLSHRDLVLACQRLSQ